MTVERLTHARTCSDTGTNACVGSCILIWMVGRPRVLISQPSVVTCVRGEQSGMRRHIDSFATGGEEASGRAVEKEEAMADDLIWPDGQGGKCHAIAK